MNIKLTEDCISFYTEEGVLGLRLKQETTRYGDRITLDTFDKRADLTQAELIQLRKWLTGRWIGE